MLFLLATHIIEIVYMEYIIMTEVCRCLLFKLTVQYMSFNTNYHFWQFVETLSPDEQTNYTSIYFTPAANIRTDQCSYSRCANSMLFCCSDKAVRNIMQKLSD